MTDERTPEEIDRMFARVAEEQRAFNAIAAVKIPHDLHAMRRNQPRWLVEQTEYHFSDNVMHTSSVLAGIGMIYLYGQGERNIAHLHDLMNSLSDAEWDKVGKIAWGGAYRGEEELDEVCHDKELRNRLYFKDAVASLMEHMCEEYALWWVLRQSSTTNDAVRTFVSVRHIAHEIGETFRRYPDLLDGVLERSPLLIKASKMPGHHWLKGMPHPDHPWHNTKEWQDALKTIRRR